MDNKITIEISIPACLDRIEMALASSNEAMRCFNDLVKVVDSYAVAKPTDTTE